MQNNKKRNTRSGLITAAFLAWLIMNIRVEAGIGTTFERAVDGLVGVSFFFVAVFLALDFFQVIGKDKEKKEDS